MAFPQYPPRSLHHPRRGIPHAPAGCAAHHPNHDGRDGRHNNLQENAPPQCRRLRRAAGPSDQNSPAIETHTAQRFTPKNPHAQRDGSYVLGASCASSLPKAARPKARPHPQTNSRKSVVEKLRIARLADGRRQLAFASIEMKTCRRNRQGHGHQRPTEASKDMWATWPNRFAR